VRHFLLVCSIVGLFVSCGTTPPAGEGPLTLYSGRNERLIGPLLVRFTAETGIDVETRYGGTSELTATLLEEGEYSPADLFLAQDAAALGALSKAGRFLPLPESVLQRVDARYRSVRSDWVGLSGRARVIVYNTDLIAAEDLPTTLLATTDPRYRGRFGIAPTNASLQAHLALFTALDGEEALDALLAGLVANEPQRYEKNSAIVQAVIDGEVEWGLVNHYYLLNALREQPDATAANYFLTGGGSASFVNLAGIGVLSDDPRAVELVRWLLGESAQQYFADETFEFPLVAGVDADPSLPPLSALETPDVDFATVADRLESTLMRIDEAGLNRF